MRTNYLVANWKQNGDLNSNQSLIESFLQIKDLTHPLVVCPSFAHIPITIAMNTKDSLHIGAQNCSKNSDGAYTGEVSCTMLDEIGCKYVIIGHSERRTLFHETDQDVVDKVKLALESGLTPILCVGESKKTREKGKSFEVVSKQVDIVLQQIEADFSRVILAYEPVWAIGTGVSATSGEASDMHSELRNYISEQNKIFADISILYGGSMKANNARELLECHDIDGGLIGGASRDANEFCKIYEILRECKQ